MTNQAIDTNFIDARLGFDPLLLTDGRLEVIVKYSGDILRHQEFFEAIELLNANYAIVTGSPQQIKSLYELSEIEYVELPKTLEYQLSNSRYSACITRAHSTTYGLSGRGTAVAIIDSGIDVTHPDFQNEDGSSRILFLWDQAGNGPPPSGFRSGSEYSRDDINGYIKAQSPSDAISLSDPSGHGTAVAGIAAGNGRSSNGRERGVAFEADIIAVKLGARGFGAFPRTTEVMRGIKYSIDKAREAGLPLSINLSFGTNNGSHSGNSLFEQYVNSASEEWKCVISAATGNEGDAGHHFSAVLTEGQTLNIPFIVSKAPSKIYMTLWKSFSDTLTFRLISPSNEMSPFIIPTQSSYSFTLSNTDVNVFYGQPTNYSPYQEVFFLFDSKGMFIPEGIWTLSVTAEEITDGGFDIWLPTIEDVTSATAFSSPDPNATITLPATAEKVISVGGYDANTNTAVSFSGRGYTRRNVYVKPDIVAPAVNVLTTRTGGGYMQFTGTSLASPFVAGSACLLMQWGIVQGNDPFLYGQRVKAFLQKGASRTLNIAYPNSIWGYGTLCLSNTLRLLTEYN